MVIVNSSSNNNNDFTSRAMESGTSCTFMVNSTDIMKKKKTRRARRAVRDNRRRCASARCAAAGGRGGRRDVTAGSRRITHTVPPPRPDGPSIPRGLRPRRPLAPYHVPRAGRSHVRRCDVRGDCPPPPSSTLPPEPFAQPVSPVPVNRRRPGEDRALTRNRLALRPRQCARRYLPDTARSTMV